MKFLFSFALVFIIIFVVSATADAIDKAPDWVLLIPVVIAGIILIREITKKETAKSKHLHDFGSGLK